VARLIRGGLALGRVADTRYEQDMADPEARPLTRRERVMLTFHRGLDRWLTPLGVWLMRRTSGRLARRWEVHALLLTTRGRRSGRDRTVVLQYFPDGEAMVIVAANDGGRSFPAWYHNLTATPDALVEVEGMSMPVRAQVLADPEAAVWWQRILEKAPDYERFRRATSRPFPVIRLSRVADAGRT
jgi:F420H(2)-dependent quinone reductase